MDFFWIFILIFGAIVSIGQKASKQQAPTDVESEPTLSPEEEMERRIRELLEGKQTPPKTTPPVQPVAKPAAPKSATTPTRPVTTLHRDTTPTHPVTTPARATRSATKASTRTNKITDPIKKGEIKQSEIGRIIDDFTIEKATIYAEIMNPKYKEY